MDKITAFAPAHSTGLFFVHDTADDPLYRGSLGAGFSIDLGVYTTVSLSSPGAGASRKPVFHIGGAETDIEELPVSKAVYQHFLRRCGDLADRELTAEHRIEPPQGSGFGTSGAGALSLAFALNAALEYPLTAEQAGGIAHVAEVESRTGLGTVIGEFFGGFEIRTEVGAPGFGKIEPMAFETGLTAVFAVFGPYSTRSALSDSRIRARIDHLGRRYYRELLASPTVDHFLEYSAAFSKGTGLMTEYCRSAIELIEREGYTGAMLMFGDAAFSLVPQEDASGLVSVLRTNFPHAEVFSSQINSTGGKVL
jgi:pantoate kinase